jgi:hypothetical protein
MPEGDEIVPLVPGGPGQFKPEVMDDDARAPYEPPPKPGSIAEQLASVPKRGRGRPPGSKNKSTLAKEASTVSTQTVDKRTATQRMAADRARTNQAAKQPVDERTPEQKRAAYQGRVEELSVSISENVNGHIAELLGAAGIPSQFIYKEGREPKHVQRDSPYTDLVDRVMVPDNTVESWAKLWAQVELTDVGKRFAGSGGGTNSNTGLVLAALFSLFGTFQYLQGIQQFAKEMKPMMDAYKQSQNIRAQQEANANNAG